MTKLLMNQNHSLKKHYLRGVYGQVWFNSWVKTQWLQKYGLIYFLVIKVKNLFPANIFYTYVEQYTSIFLSRELRQANP